MHTPAGPGSNARAGHTLLVKAPTSAIGWPLPGLERPRPAIPLLARAPARPSGGQSQASNASVNTNLSTSIHISTKSIKSNR